MKGKINQHGGWLLLAILLMPIDPLHAQEKKVQLVVLGIMQDGGLPQLGCTKSCCKSPVVKKLVTSLAIAEPAERGFSLFDAGPDIVQQCQWMDSLYSGAVLQSIYLTHAHVGHYTGLMHLGREAMNAKGIRVYAMPRMAEFIRNNGPWSQLVRLENINLYPLYAEVPQPGEHFKVTPLLVPHRDEFSETVGYRIQGPQKSVLFIPDIDKWSKWDHQLLAEIEKVDYAFLDGTFFADGELDRPMQEIPHPFISETVRLLEAAPLSVKERVYFIHFNHTNPLLNPRHPERMKLEQSGFHFAKEGAVFSL